EAALVVEAASRAAGRAHVGARALVAPFLMGGDTRAHVALADARAGGPVRFGQHADVILVADGEVARAVEPADPQPVESPFGYPYATVDLSGGRSFGPGSGDLLRRWWRVAIAAEAAGALAGALDLTVAHLTERTQFGKPLGAMQALQHRLADAYVWVEGARWLARCAAWHGADPERAATAGGYAA